MSLRKITSLTMLLSFLVLTLTSVILYIEPEGRVAYWSDWHLMWLNKRQWGNVHINIGFLFLFASLLHIFLNWKQILAYLKNKARELKIFTASFNLAIIITLAVTVGTLLNVQPFSTILEFGEGFKDAASIKYGEPPYGHAELSSLTMFCKRMGYDLQKVQDKLNQAHINYSDTKQTLLDIAQANNLTPRQVYDTIKPEAPKLAPGETLTFPEAPFPGLGRTVLADLCQTYGLNQEDVLRAFEQQHITVVPAQTLKEIAAANNSDPHALFEIIHGVAYPQM
ncbi:DUF4405 domain-containing protein [Desulfogranum japonicum]|uniref:DUF4405 domain-containing protein n=1 Tax=Desulfogranum japonicum TaxID=231447 RepID=UPI00041027D5|nr:DUF4405 domain-containing protein [Desulfogranum japonicum]